MKRYEQVLEYLQTQPVFVKNTLKYRWEVGSSSFAPICVYEDSISVNLSTDRKVFAKLLERVKNKFPYITHAVYCAWDGSCPPQLIFHFDTGLKDMRTNRGEADY